MGVGNLEDNKFSIYPNPSKGIFNLDGLSKSASINVFNAYGKLLFMVINNTKLDLSNQPNGIYLIKIQDSNGVFSTKKIILDKNEF